MEWCSSQLTPNGGLLPDLDEDRVPGVVRNDVHQVEHAPFPLPRLRGDTQSRRQLRDLFVVPADEHGLPGVRRVRENQLRNAA